MNKLLILVLLGLFKITQANSLVENSGSLSEEDEITLEGDILKYTLISSIFVGFLFIFSKKFVIFQQLFDHFQVLSLVILKIKSPSKILGAFDNKNLQIQQFFFIPNIFGEKYLDGHEQLKDNIFQSEAGALISLLIFLGILHLLLRMFSFIPVLKQFLGDKIEWKFWVNVHLLTTLVISFYSIDQIKKKNPENQVGGVAFWFSLNYLLFCLVLVCFYLRKLAVFTPKKEKNEQTNFSQSQSSNSQSQSSSSSSSESSESSESSDSSDSESEVEKDDLPENITNQDRVRYLQRRKEEKKEKKKRERKMKQRERERKIKEKVRQSYEKKLEKEKKEQAKERNLKKEREYGNSAFQVLYAGVLNFKDAQKQQDKRQTFPQMRGILKNSQQQQESEEMGLFRPVLVGESRYFMWSFLVRKYVIAMILCLLESNMGIVIGVLGVQVLFFFVQIGMRPFYQWQNNVQMMVREFLFVGLMGYLMVYQLDSDRIREGVENLQGVFLGIQIAVVGLVVFYAFAWVYYDYKKAKRMQKLQKQQKMRRQSQMRINNLLGRNSVSLMMNSSSQQSERSQEHNLQLLESLQRRNSLLRQSIALQQQQQSNQPTLINIIDEQDEFKPKKNKKIAEKKEEKSDSSSSSSNSSDSEDSIDQANSVIIESPQQNINTNQNNSSGNNNSSGQQLQMNNSGKNVVPFTSGVIQMNQPLFNGQTRDERIMGGSKRKSVKNDDIRNRLNSMPTIQMDSSNQQQQEMSQSSQKRNTIMPVQAKNFLPIDNMPLSFSNANGRKSIMRRQGTISMGNSRQNEQQQQQPQMQQSLQGRDSYLNASGGQQQRRQSMRKENFQLMGKKNSVLHQEPLQFFLKQ